MYIVQTIKPRDKHSSSGGEEKEERAGISSGTCDDAGCRGALLAPPATSL